MPDRSRRTQAWKGKRVGVTVSVHIPGGAHYAGEASVHLVRPGLTILLKKTEGSPLYRANVPPGQYALRATAEEFVAPVRPVTVAPPGTTASAYLGEKGWPYYRLGENLVPFQPPDDLLAVAFDDGTPDPTWTKTQVRRLINELRLRPFSNKRRSPTGFIVANGTIWLFRLLATAERMRVSAGIRERLERPVRIGIPVDLLPGQVKILDNLFVCRFRDHLGPDDIQAIVDEAGGEILRGFLQAGNARLIAFPTGGYSDHLGIVDDWVQAGVLVYGEPDLLCEPSDFAFPFDSPDDGEWKNGHHGNLVRQTVDQAWRSLHSVDPSMTMTLGSPAVYVATLDQGVDASNPPSTDIGGMVSDGTPRISTCYDLAGRRPCNHPSYNLVDSHGTKVYSIIAAATNNAAGISGIASNTHQIAVRYPSLISAKYSDALLWLAGFVSGNPSAGWPPEPIPHAADIINCSHGVKGLAISGFMNDTFIFLTTYGRGGKGTLLVYAAGNEHKVITGYLTWAAHPRTLAISNSNPPNSAGVERLNVTSNFGPEIDICAQGEAAPSLNLLGQVSILGDTSAAAATVSGGAALILSMERALSWVDLRDLLRDAADRIDPLNNDPAGKWVGDFSQWYGYGRLDVNEAVQNAEVFDPAGVTLLVRDDLADDGTTLPASGTFWESPDLWVRQTDPIGDPVGDPPYDVEPPHESAVVGQDNWVRVRIKNVGSRPSSTSYVRVYLTHFAGTAFVYPTNFMPSRKPGAPIPSPLVQGTYLLGEVWLPPLASRADTIVNVLWPAAMVPPNTVGGTQWHPCLLAEVSPRTGPTPSGQLVVDYTNLAQRNVTIIDLGHTPSEMTGVIGNASDSRPMKILVVQGRALPKAAKIWVRFPDPTVEAAVLAALAHMDPHAPGSGPPRVEYQGGNRVFALASGTRLVVAVPMVGGRLTPVVLGATLPDETAPGSYEVVLTEQDPGGIVLGAFALRLVQPRAPGKRRPAPGKPVRREQTRRSAPELARRRSRRRRG